MLSLLAKLFIKDNLSEIEKRSAYASMCSIAGIVLNIILSVVKIIIGCFSASITIISDGLNNFSDAASSVVTLTGFKLAAKKPDKDHPYGHGRMEYISGIIVAFLILLMAVNLIKESIVKIFKPESTVFSTITVCLLLLSIAVKCYMYYYNTSIGRRISSETILATGKDSLMDCIATSFALLSIIVERFSGLKVDGYFGVIVGGFVFYAGVSVVKDTLDPLLGLPPKPEFVQAIKDISLGFDDKILGIHDLIVHDYGPRRKFVTLHVEFSYKEDMLKIHEMIDALEKRIADELNCFVTVHMDPLVNDNDKINKLKEDVKSVIESFEYGFTFHDFRVVMGEKNTNLIFDVVVPFEAGLSDNQALDMITEKITEKLGKGYSLVISIDNDMCGV